MRQEELTDLQEIVNGKGWEARMKLAKYLQSVTVEKPDDPKPPTRTSAQNAAMHLWFTQIAEICQNQGVTMNLIIGHTHDVMVTPEAVKGLWKALMEALYGKKSTTELKKTGEIDRMIDHMVALFAKEEVELPPFPVDEKKQEQNLSGTALSQHAAKSNPDYPEQTPDTMADKFD